MEKSDQKPLAIIVAGGNGAGKTTFIKNTLPHLLAPNPMPTFINADIWQAQTFGRSGNLEEDKKAQEWAEKTREEHIKEKKSFIAETVFSHPSKVDLVANTQNAGFNVLLVHIGLDSNLALGRIGQRVKEGGHNVPSDKVKERYERLLPLVAKATQYADQTYVFDNSKVNQPHSHVMTLKQGKITELAPTIPNWAEQAYKTQIGAFLIRSQNQEEINKHPELKDIQRKIESIVKGGVRSREEVAESHAKLIEKGSIKLTTPSLGRER